MTRKFKAYDTKAKEWINPEQVLIDGNGNVFRAVDNVYVPAVGVDVCYEVGKQDEKDTPLYEGYIVETDLGEGWSEVVHTGYRSSIMHGIKPSGILTKMKVAFLSCEFRLVQLDWDGESYCQTRHIGYCKIIGNIYDNPELLTPQQLK